MKRIFVHLALFSLFLVGCDFNPPKDWPKDADIRVMSFNLRYDNKEDGIHQWSNRKEACLTMWRTTNPAIVGIQEGMQNQVDFLSKHLPNYDFVGIKNEDSFYGEYKAIFYDKERFEVLKNDTFWLSETPDVPSLGWDANNIRIVTWAQFKDKSHDGKSIFVFNTHFDHKGAKSRQESAKLLMKKIDEITNKEDTVFITGDFNTLSIDPILKPILDEFDDAHKTADLISIKNSFNAFGTWFFDRNIDFIFYRNTRALAYRTVAENFGVPYISDHYPIMTYFKY